MLWALTWRLPSVVTSPEPHSILGKQQHHPSLKMMKLRLRELNVLAGAKTRPFKKLFCRTIAWEQSLVLEELTIKKITLMTEIWADET